MSLELPPWLVHQDDALLIVDKPKGLPSQRTRAGKDGVYEWLCRHFSYVGLHHRLDQAASGLMVLTCHEKANASIARQLREHTLVRIYRARCMGDVHAGSWTWPVKGKSARTDVTPLSSSDGSTTIRCQLHTGRTHQIRIHAAMNGTPLLGDTRYGGDLVTPGPLQLHASELSVTHPFTGKTQRFEA